MCFHVLEGSVNQGHSGSVPDLDGPIATSSDHQFPISVITATARVSSLAIQTPTLH